MVEFESNGMKFFVVLIAVVFAILHQTYAESLNEDDGFRRLLRRASAEADRPLIREQRRNKDEDDEDGFSDIMEQNPSPNDIIRKRRADEDEFYHTLLSRSEPKHKEKRSFDTNDVDNKAGYIVREDWTGDSKISDADRQELENLFQKLNADDGPAKTDIARSTSDDESSAEDAAKDYATWLMKQPADKMGAALSHKAEVDHKLTKLFFHNKRASFPPPNCNEKSSHCKCRRTCHPYTVAKYSPCRCSTNNPARASIAKTPLSDSLSSKQHTPMKRHKHTDDKPSNVKYPEPIHWMTAKKSEAPKNSTVQKSNSTSENCTTAECLCERTCHPKPVASSAPCECQEKPNEGKPPGKTVLTPGSKLCTDDSPKCLCTRACYPKTILSYSPCNCEGDGDPPPKNATTPPSPPLELTNTTNNATASKEEFMKAAPSQADAVKKPALQNTTQPEQTAQAPVVPKTEPAPAATVEQVPQTQTQTPQAQQPQAALIQTPQEAGSVSMNIQKAQLCSDNSAECVCKKKCYPNYVKRVSPCACLSVEKPKQTPTETESSSLITESSKACTDNTPECNCKNMCHPTPIASVNPCYCQPSQGAGILPLVPAAQNTQTTDATTNIQNTTQIHNTTTATAVTPSNKTEAAPVPTNNTQGLVNAANVQSYTYTPYNAPAASRTQTSIAQASLLHPAAPVAAQAAVAKFEVSSTKGEQRSADPYAYGWCTRACHPLSVAAEKPCKCASGSNTANFFPPRSPENKIIKAPVSSHIKAPISNHVNPVPAKQTSPIAPAVPNVHVPATRPVEGAAITANAGSVVPQTDASAQTRNAVSASESVCARSCSPLSVASQDPCSCQNTTGALPATAPLTKDTIKPVDTTHHSYQGCYKDRKPIRDLPKRFNRFDTTPEACISECKYQNYKFAGVQYGYLCFCGNAFGRYGKVADSDCNSLCSGDSKRSCGAFWHNSVYAVDDSKEYDPSDFDFAKIDAAERLRDTLPAPAIRTVNKPAPAASTNEYSDSQGANVATHLMKAAQAALKGVSKKHKVHKKGGKQGRKDKREDDEEDAELMQEKMAAMASLGAAHEILQKTNFGLDKRDAEREKRSIDEDSDPYDPDNGKDLLAAYLANVDAYKRQVRSVDDDEEDEDPNEKPKFDYRRMVIGETDEGEFVERYNDENVEKKKKKRATDGKKKRSTAEGSGAGEKRKRSVTKGSGAGEKKSVTEGSGTGEKRKRSVSEGSGAGGKRKRSMTEGSGAGEKKKRTVSEGSGVGEKRRRSMMEGSASFQHKKLIHKRKRRAVLENSGSNKKRFVIEGNGSNKKRSIVEGSGSNKKRSVIEGSGSNKKRSTIEGSGSNKKRSIVEGSGSNKKRAIVEGSGANKRKRRSLEGSADYQRKRRGMSDEMQRVEGDKLSEIEAKLRSLEYVEKRDQIPEEALTADDESEEEEEETQGEDESGSGESDNEEESTEESEESGSESGESDDRDMSRRSAEEDMESLFSKRSVEAGKPDNSSEVGNSTENAHLKSDVEKGVDSLLNLVVELYKQQKTIKAFESSVRSLRHDILHELNVPQVKKNTATKKVREEIEKTARERLHVLTSSIEHKITEFAKSHPEASKQANLATSLLPKLPLSDEKLAESKKEISRRAAEFDDIEDAFSQNVQTEQTDLPDILKEHFRRNSEPDIEFVKQKPEVVNGEQKLSRMHREVQQSEMETGNEDDDEFEKLFQ
ncbi:uncharacterized protein LOC130657922 isoform X2 [Hydractinia symbiolongicarpus]|uniref:uncharacterized protein LOC130657922 isoform X2 n=1 Tax=Hydractinia symbiolongicarpus TaxID=13093 RepID=UPI00254A3E68|nr:uncharacterized protein LOC130657922 isoform X2 [Hydractinia symbiolongicarpus]